MAEDIKKVITIDTGQSQQTIKSFKKEMDGLRDSLLNVEKDSKEYNDIVDELKKRQDKLNQVMNITKKTINDESNALKQLRSDIKKYQNEVLNAEEGTEEWNEAMRNLANAQFQMRDMNETARYSVVDLGEQLGNVTKITQGVAAGFSAAQGVMALFGGESEDLNKVMVKLQAGIAIVQGMQGLEGLGKNIRGLSTAINSSLLPAIKNVTKVLGKTGWVAIIMAAVAAITALISHLKSVSSQQNYYEQIVRDSTRAVEEFNEALSEEEKQLSRTERILKAKGVSEEEILKNRLRELALLKEKAYWELSSALTQRSLLDENSEAWKEQNTLVNELEDTYNSLCDRVIDTKNELNALAVEAQTAAKKTAEETAKILANPPSSTLTGDEIKVDDTIEKIPDVKFEEKTNGATQRYDAKVAANELTLRKELAKTILLDEEERYNKEIELVNGFNDEKMKLLNEAIEQETDTELLGSLLLEKANLEIEIEENKNTQLAELREKDRKKREEDLQMRIAAVGTAVQATSTMLNSIADIYEASDKESEENAKKVKNLRIASAIIDTLWGAVMAYMSCIPVFTPPFNFIMGGVQAAATLATGMATINKIKNQDATKGSGSVDASSVGASVSPVQTYSTAMPMTADNQATNLKNIDTMNTDTRVYILETDIQDSKKRVEIREGETTF